MKSENTYTKENKTTGRFATAEEAARVKNAGLVTVLKKMNPKVVITSVKTERVK